MYSANIKSFVSVCVSVGIFVGMTLFASLSHEEAFAGNRHSRSTRTLPTVNGQLNIPGLESVFDSIKQDSIKAVPLPDLLKGVSFGTQFYIDLYFETGINPVQFHEQMGKLDETEQKAIPQLSISIKDQTPLSRDDQMIMDRIVLRIRSLAIVKINSIEQDSVRKKHKKNLTTSKYEDAFNQAKYNKKLYDVFNSPPLAQYSPENAAMLFAYASQDLAARGHRQLSDRKVSKLAAKVLSAYQLASQAHLSLVAQLTAMSEAIAEGQDLESISSKSPGT